MSDSWEVKIETVTACSKCAASVVVEIEPLVKAKIDALMKEYAHREWLGYLIGEGFRVKDIVIPNQTATATSVTDVVVPPEWPANIVIRGVIHSHHHMGIGFSGTDDEWINQNHDISILVNHNKMEAQVRQRTACGAMLISKADVRVVYPSTFSLEDFIAEAKERIAAPTYNQSYVYYGGNIKHTPHVVRRGGATRNANFREGGHGLFDGKDDVSLEEAITNYFAGQTAGQADGHDFTETVEGDDVARLFGFPEYLQ